MTRKGDGRHVKSDALHPNDVFRGGMGDQKQKVTSKDGELMKRELDLKVPEIVH